MDLTEIGCGDVHDIKSHSEQVLNSEQASALELHNVQVLTPNS
jgi:hypothetical protein